MKRYKTLSFPENEEQMYELMFQAFQAGISVGLVPAPDEDLWNSWINEEV